MLWKCQSDFNNKKYYIDIKKINFIIDQQIARYFVHSVNIFTTPPPFPFYATQRINPFFTSKISANQDKGWDFSQS